MDEYESPQAVENLKPTLWMAPLLVWFLEMLVTAIASYIVLVKC